MLSQRPDYSNGPHDNEDVILIKLKYLVVYIIKELIFEEEKYSFLMDIFWNNKIGQ